MNMHPPKINGWKMKFPIEMVRKIVGHLLILGGTLVPFKNSVHGKNTNRFCTTWDSTTVKKGILNISVGVGFGSLGP